MKSKLLGIPFLLFAIVAGAGAGAGAGTTTQARAATGQVISVSAADTRAVAQAPHPPAAGRGPVLPGSARAPAGATAAMASDPAVRYPADLSLDGGAVLTSVVSHPIYLDPKGKCVTFTCWGDPEAFLADLANSDYIHLVDQYVGATAPGRYTLGNSFQSISPSSKVIFDADIQALVHAAASASGQSGYGHVYHVFLAPGTDVCLDATYTVCYAPGWPVPYFLCGYHDYADFPDIGHVLYTVEPYQNVSECAIRPRTPNGPVADGATSMLSTQLMAVITDPDYSGWRNQTISYGYQGEIGQPCEFFAFIDNWYLMPSFIRSGSRTYAVAPLYSQALHGCTTTTAGP